MTDQAVDSFSPHTNASAGALAQAGIRFALRYHYNTTRAEVDRLHHAGVGFSLIGEFDTRTWHPPIHAPELGPAHAATLVAIKEALGMPDWCTAWLTQDTDFTPAQYPRAASYWAGAYPVLHAGRLLTGAYGEATFVDQLVSTGITDRAWQAGADSWAGYQTSRLKVLRQLPRQAVYGGVQCDLNDVYGDCGVWTPTGTSTPTPDPSSSPTPIQVLQEMPVMANLIVREDSEPQVYILTGDGTRKRVTGPNFANDLYLMHAGQIVVAAPPEGVRTETDPATGQKVWIVADGALDDFPVVPTVNEIAEAVAAKLAPPAPPG